MGEASGDVRFPKNQPAARGWPPQVTSSWVPTPCHFVTSPSSAYPHLPARVTSDILYLSTAGGQMSLLDLDDVSLAAPARAAGKDTWGRSGTNSPTVDDSVAWAAGLFEGEGSISRSHKDKPTSRLSFR